MQMRTTIAPRRVWTSHENANHPAKGDKTTVAGVVTDKLFQRAKVVDRNTNLMYDERIDPSVNLLLLSGRVLPLSK